MRRLTIDPRHNWQKKVEKYGFVFHTQKGEPYWDESASYQFTNFEIDSLEFATQALHEMCLDLVREVIEERMFGLFLIPAEWERYVIQSWEEDEPSVYGRFDLAYDGVGADVVSARSSDGDSRAVWVHARVRIRAPGSSGFQTGASCRTDPGELRRFVTRRAGRAG